MIKWLDAFGTNAILLALGSVWAAFRARDWRSRMRDQRVERAILALEAGITKTYETYVRAIKAARPDGKLTTEERRHARKLAEETAVEFGRTSGLDVLATLGREYMDLWIARLVRRLKRI